MITAAFDKGYDAGVYAATHSYPTATAGLPGMNNGGFKRLKQVTAFMSGYRYGFTSVSADRAIAA